MKRVSSYVDELNSGIDSKIPVRGPSSKYVLEDGFKGKLELTWADICMVCEVLYSASLSVCVCVMCIVYAINRLALLVISSPPASLQL